MTSQSPFWRAPTRPNETPNPLPDLVERLLALLLHDVPGGRSAQLSLTTDGGGDSWWAGDREATGPLLTAHAALFDGGKITLSVRAGEPETEPAQAQLQRFIRPLMACLALQRRLDDDAGRARDAVAAIERLAVLDLATGIVMARRDCDPRTARDLLIAWSAEEGLDLQSLTPADVLERLGQVS